MKKITPAELTALFPFLRTTPELTGELLARGLPQTFPAGTNLYWEGDSCTQIVFLLAGEIRVFKAHPGGREITLYEISPGETCILNASCILARTGYPANARSSSAIATLLLPAADFTTLMERHPELRAYVFNLLGQRLTAVMTLLEEVVFNRMDERLGEYLLERSADQFLETTHQAIANDLGTSREVVSRLLKEMERGGKVTLSRNAIRLLTW
ncbi:MAG: Crp/Fnr family transcriptional regulator [Desulfobulbaceae bacterium]|nr:Crp/Fnr family transcriptional regulator [Desulfobulbaceae bacterium]